MWGASGMGWATFVFGPHVFVFASLVSATQTAPGYRVNESEGKEGVKGEEQ